MTAMHRRFMLLLCLFGFASSAIAESVYVNDSLYIGLHQDNTLASTIIELIPSGTELELLAREGKLLQVRTQTGITGWVDASYISDQAPGRAQLDTLKSRLQAETERIKELQEKLRQAEQRSQEAASQVARTAKPQPASEPAPIPSSTLREMQTLAEENQRLKQQVAELEAMAAMAVERVQANESASKLSQENLADSGTRNPQTPASDGTFRWAGLKYWQQILFASVLLLAFAVGGWLVDLSVRRRHGGHRI